MLLALPALGARSLRACLFGPGHWWAVPTSKQRCSLTITPHWLTFLNESFDAFLLQLPCDLLEVNAYFA